MLCNKVYFPCYCSCFDGNDDDDIGVDCLSFNSAFWAKLLTVRPRVTDDCKNNGAENRQQIEDVVFKVLVSFAIFIRQILLELLITPNTSADHCRDILLYFWL